MLDLSFIFIYSFLQSFTGFKNQAGSLLQAEEIRYCGEEGLGSGVPPL